MKQELVHRLQSQVQDMPVQLRNLSSSMLQHKPNPDKWSKQEILGHLIDSALYNLMRFTRLRISPEAYQIVAYPQDQLVGANAYQDQSVEHLVNLWATLNAQIVAVWKSYQPEELEKTVINHDGQQGPVTWWMNDYLQHLEHHQRQIFGGKRDSA